MPSWSAYTLIAALVTAAVVTVCSSCAKQTPAPVPPQSEPVCGGTEDNTDPNAPKTVEDTRIASFSFSASTFGSQNDLLIPKRYEFSAAREGDVVNCTCARNGNEHAFTADPSFMDELQDVVARYDFAAGNGVDRFTAGLPDDFGGTFKVEYAGGERIYFSDNQSIFCPDDAVADLARLFYGAGRVYDVIEQDEAYVIGHSNPRALILDVRREDEYAEGHIRNAVCLPNEDIQAGKLEKLPDKDQILLIYCRSGRRSKEAAQALADAGYWNVFEFGGILDWTGEIVKEG